MLFSCPIFAELAQISHALFRVALLVLQRLFLRVSYSRHNAHHMLLT
jgi:hypothetical protein